MVNMRLGCDRTYHRDDEIMKRWFRVDEASARSILMTTIHQFKGLESNIVVLIDDGTLTDEERYVGESRAKYELYVVSA